MHTRMRKGMMQMLRIRKGTNSERQTMVTVPSQTIKNALASETAAFLVALIRMDLDRVRELLERDSSLANVPMNVHILDWFALAPVNCDARFILPSFPLHYAVKRDHAELVALLLRFNADVHAREKGKWNRTNFTPLHFAKSREVALLLLDRGADPNGKDGGLGDMHPSPLPGALFATRDWQVAGVAEVLIQRGADINLTWGEDGHACIHEAAGALWHELKVMEFLLDQGVDVNARTTAKRKTPLHYVCNYGNNDEQRSTSLEAARLLLRRGADVDARDNDGHTTSFFACEYNRLDMAQLLIDHGADISLDGESTLYGALKKNNLEIIRFLLNHGINVNCRAPTFGMITPLMFCVEQGHLESSAILLLEQGADIHASNLQGETPFLLACECQALDLIYLMLRLSPHHQRPQLLSG